MEKQIQIKSGSAARRQSVLRWTAPAQVRPAAKRRRRHRDRVPGILGWRRRRADRLRPFGSRGRDRGRRGPLQRRLQAGALLLAWSRRALLRPGHQRRPAPATGEQVIPKPDLVATDCGATTFFASPQAGVWRFCGTSAAAPHAAAVAALIRQANPGASAAQVRSALTSTARPVGAFGVSAVGSASSTPTAPSPPWRCRRGSRSRRAGGAEPQSSAGDRVQRQPPGRLQPARSTAPPQSPAPRPSACRRRWPTAATGSPSAASTSPAAPAAARRQLRDRHQGATHAHRQAPTEAAPEPPPAGACDFRFKANEGGVRFVARSTAACSGSRPPPRAPLRRRPAHGPGARPGRRRQRRPLPGRLPFRVKRLKRG